MEDKHEAILRQAAAAASRIMDAPDLPVLNRNPLLARSRRISREVRVLLRELRRTLLSRGVAPALLEEAFGSSFAKLKGLERNLDELSIAALGNEHLLARIQPRVQRAPNDQAPTRP